MELRPLGSTGMQVSVLGLGTVKIGRNEGVKYPSGFELPDDAEVRDLLALARELGINLIDTAPAYGTSEERLGKLLPDTGDWIIVSKVGESFEDGQSSFDFSAAGTRASIERSLRRLGRDYIDAVLVHSDGDDMRIIHEEPVLETLDRLKQEGLIRAYGMSTKTVEGGLWVVEHCDIVMATCNPEYTDELPVLEAAATHHKGVLIKKAFMSGHLHRLEGGDPVETSLRFVFSQPGVSSVVLGTINPEHLKSNAAAVERILGS
jgi:aryl-alcohol dehydrogenase-like predicted oxidoreductase